MYPAMTNENDDSVSKGLIAEGAAGVVGLLGTAVGGPAAGLAATATTSAVIKRARKAAGSRMEARVLEFETQLLDQLSAADVEDGERIIEEQEGAEEAILEAYRRSVSALDPAVIPVLARLIVRNRFRSPDAFSRGVGRLLEDLSRSELEDLRTMPIRMLNKPSSGCSLASGVFA